MIGRRGFERDYSWRSGSVMVVTIVATSIGKTVWSAPTHPMRNTDNDARALRLAKLLNDPLALNCILAADKPPGGYPELDLDALRRVAGST